VSPHPACTSAIRLGQFEVGGPGLERPEAIGRGGFGVAGVDLEPVDLIYDIRRARTRADPKAC
jgi:hypothetical protein